MPGTAIDAAFEVTPRDGSRMMAPRRRPMPRDIVRSILVLLVLAPLAGAQLATMTHSVSRLPALGAVACTDSGGTTTLQNGYWRDYDPAVEGVSGAVFLHGADVGVELVDTTSSGNGAHACTLTLYSNPAPGTIDQSIAALETIASETFYIDDVSLAVAALRFTQPAPPFVPDGGNSLVCELSTPAAGDRFFFGANSAGQTGRSYLSAPACGLPLPTDTQSLLQGGMFLIFDVVYDPSNAVTPSGRPGTGEDLVLLTGVAGGTPDTLDSKSALASGNESLRIDLLSPNADFFASTYLVVATLASQGRAYVDVTGGFGSIWLPASGVGAIFDISGGATVVPGLGERPILAGGFTRTFILSSSLVGTELGLQGLADTGTLAANEVYASSRHHVITLN